MEYIVIPVKDEDESQFFLGLLGRMKKKASKMSAVDMEDLYLLEALRKGEQSGKGSLTSVKSHLKKLTSGK